MLLPERTRIHAAKRGGSPLGPVAERVQLSLGAALRHLRQTRTTMSARAFSMAVGLSPSYVGKVESEAIEPSFHAFSKMAAGLDLTATEILVLVHQEARR